MIVRLTSTLRDLASLSAEELASPEARRMRADCADAVRLELDCPQQSLTSAQRMALKRLDDLLDRDHANDSLAEAVRTAVVALGVR